VDLSVRLRAVQFLRPGLVVSHRSAAELWEIETLNPAAPAQGTLEFTAPERAVRHQGEGMLVHRMALGVRDLDRRDGLRVTGVDRTLGDLLRAGPRDAALVAVESALTWRRVGKVRRPPLTTRSRIALALEVPARGAERARRWLRLADLSAGSPAETVARLRLHDAGLRPESQAELRTPDGRRRYLDFLFRAEGLAVEIEGYAYHGTHESHRRDVARFNQILQCPEVRLLLRYTAADVFHHPARMIEEIHANLADLTTLAALRGSGTPAVETVSRSPPASPESSPSSHPLADLGPDLTPTPPRNSPFTTFPLAFRGNSPTNSTTLGTL
jgi:very-short-patch-repair endonuclease